MTRLTMRDKGFWRRLTKAERADLVYLQMHSRGGGFGGGGYLPDDCSECSACGEPVFGYGGWCGGCGRRYAALYDKASGKERGAHVL